MSNTWRTTRPVTGEYNPYFGTYIDKVPDGDIIDILTRQLPETTSFLLSIPESKGGHRYAPGKWSIREIIGHLSDCERIFGYRALRFARADTTPVPGFDENEFVANARFDERTIEDLTSEFEYVRRSTIGLLGSLNEEEMSRRGTANNNPISVRAVCFVMAGHVTHHAEFMRAHYL
jgi:hypothetical protein